MAERLKSGPAAALLAMIVVTAFAGPFLAPFDAISQDRNAPFTPPGRVHWLGTDGFGRDEFARLLSGARLSILAGSLATAVALACGASAGAISGYYACERPWVDAILMRTAEMFQSLPWIYLLLGIRALLPLTLALSVALLFIALTAGFTGWPRAARLIRGSVMAERQRDYVAAARAFGGSGFYIIRRHLYPAVSGLLLVQAVLLLPRFMLAEVTLSFLGLGIAEPAPSLGNMLEALRNLHVLISCPWMLAPGALLALITGCSQAVGEVLRERYGP